MTILAGAALEVGVALLTVAIVCGSTGGACRSTRQGSAPREAVTAATVIGVVLTMVAVASAVAASWLVTLDSDALRSCPACSPLARGRGARGARLPSAHAARSRRRARRGARAARLLGAARGAAAALGAAAPARGAHNGRALARSRARRRACSLRHRAARCGVAAGGRAPDADDAGASRPPSRAARRIRRGRHGRDDRARAARRGDRRGRRGTARAPTPRYYTRSDAAILHALRRRDTARAPTPRPARATTAPPPSAGPFANGC